MSGIRCYAHKLLTGRLGTSSGASARTGASPVFPSRDESAFDFYGTGHSSNSGQRRRRRVEGGLRGQAREPGPGRVVAVIGDGALTGGMAYEALNHAGHLRTPVLVVFNDNAMSIEKNVGAISTYLSRLRTDPTLYDSGVTSSDDCRRLPGVGDRWPPWACS